MSDEEKDDRSVWDLFKEQMLIGPARDKFNRFDFPVQRGEQSLLAAQWYLSGLYSFAVCRSYIQFAWPTKDEIREAGGEKLTTHIKKIQSQQSKWIKNHLTDDLPYLKKIIQESFTDIVGIKKINKLNKKNNNNNDKILKKKKKKNRKRKHLSDDNNDNDNNNELNSSQNENDSGNNLSENDINEPPKKKKKKNKKNIKKIDDIKVKSRSKSPGKGSKKVVKAKSPTKKKKKIEIDEDVDIIINESEKNILKPKKKRKKNIISKKNENNNDNNKKSNEKYYVRRAKSAWDFYRAEFSEKHKNEYAGKNMCSVNQDASKVWKIMSNDDKKRFELMAEKDKLLIDKARKDFENGKNIDNNLLKKFSAKQIKKKNENKDKLNKKKNKKTEENIEIIKDSESESDNNRKKNEDNIENIINNENDFDLFSSQPPEISDDIDINKKINEIDEDDDKKDINDEIEEDSEESSASLNLG